MCIHQINEYRQFPWQVLQAESLNLMSKWTNSALVNYTDFKQKKNFKTSHFSILNMSLGLWLFEYSLYPGCQTGCPCHSRTIELMTEMYKSISTYDRTFIGMWRAMNCICPRKNAHQRKVDYIQALRYCGVQFMCNIFSRQKVQDVYV